MRGGVYTFTFTGMTAKNVIISGPYSIAEGRITFKEMSAACSSMHASGGCRPIMGCRGAGVYHFKRNGRALSFVRVRDPHCLYRPIVLSGRFRRTRWRRTWRAGPMRVACLFDRVPTRLLVAQSRRRAGAAGLATRENSRRSFARGQLVCGGPTRCQLTPSVVRHRLLSRPSSHACDASAGRRTWSGLAGG